MATEAYSLIIAFIALLLTFWQLYEIRKYNRISHRPMLIITRHFGGSKGRYGISVKNAGLGPAMITKCKVTLDDHEMMEDGGDHGWNAAIARLGFSNRELAFRVIAPNGKLAHGDSEWLLYIRDEHANEQNILKLQNAVTDLALGVKITYKSMFGEEMNEYFR